MHLFLIPSTLLLAALALVCPRVATCAAILFTDAEDTWISSGTSGFNYGADPIMGLYSDGSFSSFETRDLVRFDVTSLSGIAAAVIDVRLRMYVSGVGSGIHIVDAYLIAAANADWLEGDGSLVPGGMAASDGFATWSQHTQGQRNWAGAPGLTTPGVDYDSNPVASQTFDSSGGLTYTQVEFAFNRTDFMDDWISGENPGLLLVLRADPNRLQQTVVFFTDEVVPDEVQQIFGVDGPQLYVEFTPVPLPPAYLALIGPIAVLFKRNGRRCSTELFWPYSPPSEKP